MKAADRCSQEEKGWRMPGPKKKDKKGVPSQYYNSFI